MKIECSNCEWTGSENDVDLGDVENLFDRIDPGSEVPAGECPKCGCLTYVAEADNIYAAEVRTLRAENETMREVLQEVIDLDCPSQDMGGDWGTVEWLSWVGSAIEKARKTILDSVKK